MNRSKFVRKFHEYEYNRLVRFSRSIDGAILEMDLRQQRTLYFAAIVHRLRNNKSMDSDVCHHFQYTTNGHLFLAFIFHAAHIFHRRQFL